MAEPVRAATAITPRPARDTRLDVLRGWLQVSIFVSHSHGAWAQLWLIHGVWGLSDSSEQFVFLSGLMLGSVFARKEARDGWPAAARDMLRRAARLWRTDVVTLALFGAMILVTDRLMPGEAADYGWVYVLQDTPRAVLGLLTLSYQPAYLDALSVFIWSMVALPAFAWAVGRAGAWALLPSAVLWACAQAGWLAAPDISGAYPPAFNVFAWQVIFMLGAWLGRRRLLTGTAVGWRPVLFAVAVAVVAAGFVLRLSEHGLVPLGLPVVGISVEDKAVLSPVRFAHALALAYVVARLTPQDAAWMRTRVAGWLATAGRHSLNVFCAGLFLSYIATVLLRSMPLSGWVAEPGLLLGGVALLLLYARRLDRAR